jgi:hypothetical protein
MLLAHTSIAGFFDGLTLLYTEQKRDIYKQDRAAFSSRPRPPTSAAADDSDSQVPPGAWPSEPPNKAQGWFEWFFSSWSTDNPAHGDRPPRSAPRNRANHPSVGISMQDLAAFLDSLEGLYWSDDHGGRVSRFCSVFFQIYR